ncbi:ATP-binding protein [Streptomyces sp. NPDC052101]|uniref:ATP-binding protein n=1 Tax=Streptomyces sp. NPDC052101 TaxID=3155763 RepID=UPI00343AC20A
MLRSKAGYDKRRHYFTTRLVYQATSTRCVMASSAKIQVSWIVLPAVPSAVWFCRRFVIDTLHRWDMLGLVDAVQLVAAELVLNAVRASTAAGTDVTVCLWAERGSLFVEVGDYMEELPTLRRPTPEDGRGLGLSVVSSMSKRWGIRQEGSGKVVWSELSYA